MNRQFFTLCRPSLRNRFLMIFLSIQLSCQLFAGIIFDGSPGTTAPPSTLGPWSMIPFASDARPYPADVTTVPYSSVCPGEIAFSASGMPIGLHHVKVGDGWDTWSHGYLGDVYNTSLSIITINLPAGTNAFYFYAEPNVQLPYNVVATANDGTTSGPIVIDGFGGAHYIGFYTTGAACVLTTIQITMPVAAAGFAVGEFGINLSVPHIGAMVCDDDIQVSFDESCLVTVEPSMVLEGENWSCGVPDYIITVTDWVTGEAIDDHPAPGPQLGITRAGKSYKVMIKDPITGNLCWSKIRVEDKQAPLLICPEEFFVLCGADLSPLALGSPFVIENCGAASLTYYDVIENGSCSLGYEKIIYRHWVAIDGAKNKGECIQKITVNLAPLAFVSTPPHYDGLAGHQPMLLCSQKLDTSKDISTHIVGAPLCVDGYLLDSTYYLATGLRRPKVLGWNCIEAGSYATHPSPDPIYYPAHPDAVSCWNSNTNIMWLGTGRPANNTCSNIASTFSDVKISLAKDNCDAGEVGCYKILRQWSMVDWCSGSVREYSQIIKVMDTLGPQILYPDSISIGTDIWECKGKWVISAPWIKDDCSITTSYTVRLSIGTVTGDETNGYVAVDLPLGTQEAWIVAEDCCGNVTEKKIIIDVRDDSPPNPVCQTKTVVSITGNLSPGENTAKVLAESFNDGSHDNCSNHLYFKVIRMDELAGTLSGTTASQTSICKGANGDDDPARTGNQVYFDDAVKFCCTDVGNSIRVVFRVFDTNPGVGGIQPSWMLPGGFLWGRYSDCMVEVEVQDKSIPTLVAPPDVVVSCMYWFDINALSNPNDSTFGKIVKDIAWRGKVSTKDIVCNQFCEAHLLSGYPGYVAGFPPHLQPAPNKACNYFDDLFSNSHPDDKYDLLWGSDGYILSACGIDPIINVEDLRQCGVGKIQRNFIARGSNGAFVRATQTIWVVDCDPFYISETHCSNTDDIIWPNCDGSPVLVEGCNANTSPDNPALGKPIIVNGADDHCALIAIAYEDEQFDIEPDACYKILRKWKVIDWCNYDPIRAPNTGRWSFTQIIKVSDKNKPTVTCSTGPCTPAVRNSSTGRCMSHIEIIPMAFDSCTPENWLFYEYKLDLFNDGSFEYHVGSNTKLAHQRGELPAFHNNPFADDDTKGFDATGIYPIGKHRFQFYVEDGCGNLTKCDTVITVKDCKAPTPYCHPGIITVPMPSSGCIDVWAIDLNRGSFDNCTEENKLKFYFDGDTSKKSVRICCEDFVRDRIKDQYILDVEMWVEDEEGNTDFCKTTIVIQDNGLCPDPSTFSKSTISGLIKTSDNKAINQVDVDLYNAGALLSSNKTSANGMYLFKDLRVNDDFIVKPVAKEDYLNGISTADIAKIQKHIIGTESITDPYLLIAADINKSGSITAADLTDLRKLILGNIAKFSRNLSWVYIPSDFHFTDPTSPYTFPTERMVRTLEESMYMNFIGVKIGDINRSAIVNLQDKGTTRSTKNFTLEINSKSVNSGENYIMDVYSSQLQEIAGMQFTLNFDASKLEFLKVSSSAIQIEDNNLGLHSVDQGKIAFSWNETNRQISNGEEKLFQIHFKVKQGSEIANIIRLTSDITNAEAYDHTLAPMDIELKSRNSISSKELDFELYQNNPNPFKDQTAIQFYVSQEEAVTLTIYDLSGKVIYIKETDATKGLNTITIQKSKFNGSGIYYYQLDSKNHTDTKRMVLLD